MEHMREGRFDRRSDRKGHRYGPAALRILLASMLIAHGFPAPAQTVGEPAERPVLRLLAPSSRDGDGAQHLLRNAQFMPGMPMPPMMQMQMPPMMAPRAGGSQGSMGGGMTMVMTGDTVIEMTAGACAAGLFIGGVAAAVATAPAAPVTASVILSSAGIGCGFAVAATAAGMVGMLGGRALSGLFQ
jgi:hypothetical protein